MSRYQLGEGTRTPRVGTDNQSLARQEGRPISAEDRQLHTLGARILAGYNRRASAATAGLPIEACADDPAIELHDVDRGTIGRVAPWAVMVGRRPR